MMAYYIKVQYMMELICYFFSDESFNLIDKKNCMRLVKQIWLYRNESIGGVLVGYKCTRDGAS